jgi:hypothetical protein
MSTSPAENPVTGVVAFTARGEAALDELAAILTAQCDGTPEGIAELLNQVLDADIAQLAEALNEAAGASRRRPAVAADADNDLAPLSESADEAARRRLGEHSRVGGPDAPATRPLSR